MYKSGLCSPPWVNTPKLLPASGLSASRHSFKWLPGFDPEYLGCCLGAAVDHSTKANYGQVLQAKS